VNVSPLRERREDIPLLARYFVEKHTRAWTGTSKAFRRMHWMRSPITTGRAIFANIRELQNVIKRSVVLSEGPELHVALPENTGKSAPIVVHGPALNVAGLSERVRILQVLKETKGMVGAPDGAAARLGLKRTTLQSRMRRYNIARLFQQGSDKTAVTRRARPSVFRLQPG